MQATTKMNKKKQHLSVYIKKNIYIENRGFYEEDSIYRQNYLY